MIVMTLIKIIDIHDTESICHLPWSSVISLGYDKICKICVILCQKATENTGGAITWTHKSVLRRVYWKEHVIEEDSLC